MIGATSSSLARFIEKPCWSGLAKFATEDLLALERELRKLQEPHGRVFWRLEQFIGPIGDELGRRTS